jgi:[acyl-carrier-protein] S-malonyltransferase
MDAAADEFKIAVNAVKFNMGNVDVLHNFDTLKASNVGDIKAKLISQLHKPVLWTGTIKAMHNMGVQKIIESGPGKILTGLTKRIEKTLTSNAVFDSKSLTATLEEIK